MIRAVLFDFGGVIAEEGFYKGLRVIAEENGLAPEAFFKTADEIIHGIGYVTGRATERENWDAVRKETGIRRDDGYLLRTGPLPVCHPAGHARLCGQPSGVREACMYSQRPDRLA